MRLNDTERDEISSLPGQFLFSVDTVVREAQEVAALGIPAVILFGLPKQKDEVGSEICRRPSLTQRWRIGTELEQEVAEVLAFPNIDRCCHPPSSRPRR